MKRHQKEEIKLEIIYPTDYFKPKEYRNRIYAPLITFDKMKDAWASLSKKNVHYTWIGLAVELGCERSALLKWRKNVKRTPEEKALITQIEYEMEQQNLDYMKYEDKVGNKGIFLLKAQSGYIEEKDARKLANEKYKLQLEEQAQRHQQEMDKARLEIARQKAELEKLRAEQDKTEAQSINITFNGKKIGESDEL